MITFLLLLLGVMFVFAKAFIFIVALVLSIIFSIIFKGGDNDGR